MKSPTFANSLSVYFKLVRNSFRQQMQFRLSFAMQALGGFLITFSEFLGLYVLFERFKTIKGWTLPEVGVFYGVVNLSFALSEAVSRGFDLFGDLLKSGDFDRLLLRPRTTVLQLFGQELTVKRIGRIAQGCVVLAWSLSHFELNFVKVALLGAAIAAGFLLFVSLYILQASFMFWSIEGLKIFDSVTYGGVETGQYPISIYPNFFRKFFTFVVPLSLVSYFPVLIVIGKDDPLGSSKFLQAAAPLGVLLFFGFSLWCWGRGVRRYQSAGG